MLKGLLVPSDDQIAEWREDYRAMQGPMFFGESPDFDEMMVVVKEFENTFNAGYYE